MTDLENVLKSFEVDQDWYGEKCEKYKKLFNKQELNSLLINFTSDQKSNIKSLYDMKEQFEEPAKMLYEHLIQMTNVINTKSDQLPAIRANLGVGFIPSVFGIEQRLFTDKMPWPVGHLTIEEIKALDPEEFSSEENIKDKGLVPYARKIYQYYQDKLGTNQFFYLPDTQGVLDIAHLLAGDQLFYMIYDDPALVHHLMEISLQAYISISKYIKKIIGEDLSSGKHMGIAMYNGGVRYCMDTTVLLNSEQIIEFEIPYLRRALAEFGGGWIHFCGYAPHLLDILVDVPELRGINPNYMVNQEYDYERDVQQILSHNKFFLGAPFKSSDQSIEEYFTKVLKPYSKKKGLIFTPRGERLDFSNPKNIINIWNETQKKIIG